MALQSANGDIEPNKGKLYKISKQNRCHPKEEIKPISIGNGLAWNKANNKFYYIDTPTQNVMVYEFNDVRATLGRGRVLIDLNKEICLQKNDQNPSLVGPNPDGMAIDDDDNLWIALYNYGSIVKVDTKTGKIVYRIALPVYYVTSAAWGGLNRDVLFITTSRALEDKQGLEQRPLAGAVFTAKGLGVTGPNPYLANLGDHLKECSSD